jgi:hypothetical protein
MKEKTCLGVLFIACSRSLADSPTRRLPQSSASQQHVSSPMRQCATATDGMMQGGAEQLLHSLRLCATLNLSIDLQPDSR